MRVKMLKTVPGSPDGIVTRTFAEGSEHDLGGTAREKDLAEVFVREGWAHEVGREPAPEKSVLRLPPLEEYVAAGYAAADYDKFIADAKAGAAAAGETAEVFADPEALAEIQEIGGAAIQAALAEETAPPAAPVEAPPPPPESASAPKTSKRKKKDE
jgi:hypothetical protein